MNIHKLDIPGCLTLLTTVAGLTVFCNNRLYLFWGKQQTRLACVDIIPVLATDMASTKQDVAVIKRDVAAIKDLLERRPWFRL